jgi:4'-phosphopantetheinyl transferase
MIQAPEYLELLSPAEREVATRKYHFPDACMALGSALLKRAYISNCTGLDWSEITFSRRLDEKLGKPCWHPPNDGKNWPTIDFNVSHQRGIVVLVGACTQSMLGERSDPDVEVAVDVVSPNERNDMSSIASSNFAEFVSTFESVLSDEEVFTVTYTLPTNGTTQLLSGESVPNEKLGRLDRTIECGQTLSVQLDGDRKINLPSELIIEEKLRNFYANFSLKEAFTKLGGLGLSAPWLKDCEFVGVRAPTKGGVRRCNILGTWGEIIRGEDMEIRMNGKEVHDVASEQQSLEEDYIITTMLRPSTVLKDRNFPAWTTINVHDILP